jgi:hypothetical protein
VRCCRERLALDLAMPRATSAYVSFAGGSFLADHYVD